MTQFSLELIVERRDEIAYQEQILQAQPDELMFHPRFKDVGVEGDRLIVTSRTSEPLAARNRRRHIVIEPDRGHYCPPRNRARIASCRRVWATEKRSPVAEFVYVAWLRDSTLGETDQDHEYPAVVLIHATDVSAAKSWGDELYSRVIAEQRQLTLIRSEMQSRHDPMYDDADWASVPQTSVGAQIPLDRLW